MINISPLTIYHSQMDALLYSKHSTIILTDLAINCSEQTIIPHHFYQHCTFSICQLPPTYRPVYHFQKVSVVW